MISNTQITQNQIDFFNTEGYLIIENIITNTDIEIYCNLYNSLAYGKIDVYKNKSKFGDDFGISNTWIIHSEPFISELLFMPYHIRIKLIAQQILGSEVTVDSDSFINIGFQSRMPKYTDEKIVHQEILPAKSTINFRLALDKSTIENGCLWCIPGSHLAYADNYFEDNKTELNCRHNEKDGVFIELKAGSCALLHNRLQHCYNLNTTNNFIRAISTKLQSL